MQRSMTPGKKHVMPEFRMLKLALVCCFFTAAAAGPMLGQGPDEQTSAALQAAQKAEAQQDFTTAAHQFSIAARRLPRNAEIQSNLGVALYFDRQLNPALAAFHRATLLDPNLMPPHLFSGLALYHQGNPDAAAPELEKALALAPDDVIARTWLGYAYLDQGRDEDALKEFKGVCQRAPDNIDAWYAVGQTSLQLGYALSRKLVDTAPNGGRALQLAAEQFQLRGDSARALADYRAAYERRPDIAELPSTIMALQGTVPKPPATQPANTGQEDALYFQAHAAEQESRAAFEQVLQLAPDSYRAHQILANALLAEKKPDEALAEFHAVLERKPDLPGIHQAIGTELLDEGKLQESLHEFRQELVLQPKNATVLMNTGRLLLMTGQDDEAATMLNAALKADRPPDDTYLLLGRLELRRKHYASAIAMLTRYTSVNASDPEGYYLLSRAYRAVGDTVQMGAALGLFKAHSQEAQRRGLATTEMESLANTRRPAPANAVDDQ